MKYGYCRISTNKQSIERQVRNISKAYPDAHIIQEAFTGTTTRRPKWEQLKRTALKQAERGESVTIIFDSVSRMSRNAEEGFQLYEELYNAGIELIFLKEHHIDTLTYKTALQVNLPETGTSVDILLDGVKKYLMELAKEQIRIAFDQAEKEVMDLRQRTKEGLVSARLAGKHIGRRKGVKVETMKQRRGIEVIRQYSQDFGGSLDDASCQQLIGCSRNSYYKYKRLARA